MTFPTTYTTSSHQETHTLAREFAQELIGGDVIALIGDLGAGKTTFTQGVAQGLGVITRVTSPTFVVMRHYPTKQGLQINHLDLYRMESEEELRSIDLAELTSDAQAITIIEWPEKAAATILPIATYTITILPTDSGARQITLTKAV